jgi:hypothetical protein
MMEAVCISETSVNIYLTTRQYIPEDSKLHHDILFHLFVVYLMALFQKLSLYSVEWNGDEWMMNWILKETVMALF